MSAVYGHTFDDFINSRKEESLFESSIILYDKKKKGEIELYVRDGSEKTAGTSISKDDKEGKSQHAASVKLKSPKQITGSTGIPIEIHSGKIDWNEKKFTKLKEIPTQDKKVVMDFLKANREELDKLYYESDPKEKEKLWKTIIDNSSLEIKSIRVADDPDGTIKEYFKSKKEE